MERLEPLHASKVLPFSLHPKFAYHKVFTFVHEIVVPYVQ